MTQTSSAPPAQTVAPRAVMPKLATPQRPFSSMPRMCAPMPMRTSVTPVLQTPALLTTRMPMTSSPSVQHRYTIPMRPVFSAIRAPGLSNTLLPVTVLTPHNSVTPRQPVAADALRTGSQPLPANCKTLVCNVQDRMLSLESKFDGDFIINQRPLLLDIDHPTTPDETGFRVWDAGIVMSKYIELKQTEFPKMRVLELGCGSGISGLSWALCGHDVTLTDRIQIQQRTERNIERNRAEITSAGGSCVFKVLDWNNPSDLQRTPHDFDIVLASDVIWAHVFIASFLNALNEVTNDSTKILMAHKRRSVELDEQFIKACPAHAFEVVAMIHPSDFLDTQYCLEQVCIYELRRMKGGVTESAVEATTSTAKAVESAVEEKDVVETVATTGAD